MRWTILLIVGALTLPVIAGPIGASHGDERTLSGTILAGTEGVAAGARTHLLVGVSGVTPSFGPRVYADAAVLTVQVGADGPCDDGSGGQCGTLHASFTVASDADPPLVGAGVPSAALRVYTDTGAIAYEGQPGSSGSTMGALVVEPGTYHVAVVAVRGAAMSFGLNVGVS